jgi:hypothetical protein
MEVIEPLGDALGILPVNREVGLPDAKIDAKPDSKAGNAAQKSKRK